MSNEINRLNKLESQTQEQSLRLKKLERLAQQGEFSWKFWVGLGVKLLASYFIAIFVLEQDLGFTTEQRALAVPATLAIFYLTDFAINQWKKR